MSFWRISLEEGPTHHVGREMPRWRCYKTETVIYKSPLIPSQPIIIYLPRGTLAPPHHLPLPLLKCHSYWFCIAYSETFLIIFKPHRDNILRYHGRLIFSFIHTHGKLRENLESPFLMILSFFVIKYVMGFIYLSIFFLVVVHID